MFDTLTWSRFAWAYFHLASTSYPLIPTDIDFYNYHEFYKFFGLTLPCSACSQHYSKLFIDIPIDAALASRELLFKWTVDIHNAVNTSIGKKEMKLATAIRRYMSNRALFIDPPNILLICLFLVMACTIAILFMTK